jgi:hypothetical protein
LEEHLKVVIYQSNMAFKSISMQIILYCIYREINIAHLHMTKGNKCSTITVCLQTTEQSWEVKAAH